MKKPRIRFEASGRGKAQCPPDPKYPKGLVMDASRSGVPSCHFDLPYPAPECGTFIVECDECPFSIAITAAGRPDDPISVRFACPHKLNSN